MISSQTPSRRALVSGPLLLAGALAACATAPAASQSSSESALVDDFLDAYRAMDVNAMLGFLAEDVYFEDPTFHLRANNHEEMRQIIEPASRIFSDVTITPFNRILAPPWVIVQQRLGGSMRRDDGEVRRIDVQGASMFEVRAGRIASWYDYYDVLAYRRQVGAAPSAG